MFAGRALQALAFLTGALSLSAQEERVWTAADSSYAFSVLGEDRDTRFEDDRVYYSFHDHQIKHNQGGAQGDLLTGTFTVTDRAGNIMRLGEFKKGLKHGDWFTWDSEGKLIRKEQYRHGLLHGSLYRYESGERVEEQRFRQGRRHGRSTDLKTEEVTRFRRGEQIVKQEDPSEKIQPMTKEGDGEDKEAKKARRGKKDREAGAAEKKAEKKDKQTKEKTKKEKPEKGKKRDAGKESKKRKDR